LAGNRDIEDSLERLDKLTQEEARMASAEQLKMTRNVEGKVMGVNDRVRCVEGQVQEVHGDVRDVGSKVQTVEVCVQDVRSDVHDVGSKVQGVVQGVRADVQDVRGDMQVVGNKVQDVDDKLDQANRSLYLSSLIVIPRAQTTSQGTSSGIIF
jgi:archaellum component FlaC